MGEVRELVREPEYGDGDEGGGDMEGFECEHCGQTEFALWMDEEGGRCICTYCHRPQTSIYWDSWE